MRMLVAVVLLAACGGAQPAQEPLANSVPRPPPDAAVDAALTYEQAVLAKLRSVRDEVCRCTDKPCADRVAQDMGRWTQQMTASEYAPSSQLSDAAMREATGLGDAIAKCMVAAMNQPP